MFCESRMYGVKCSLDGRPGRKAYVLCGDCFESVEGSSGDSKP